MSEENQNIVIHCPSRDHLLTILSRRILGANPVFEDDNKQTQPITVKVISDEAIEAACDVLDDSINSCDSGEQDHDGWLQEARDFLWSHHFTQKANSATP